MSDIAAKVRSGYSDIIRHHNPKDAYEDYHEFLNGSGLTPSVIHELSLGSLIVPRVQSSIQTLRRAKVSIGARESRYFRGSGAIAVGDASGNIIGVQYDPAAGYRNDPEPNTDPVARQHGNYPYVALRKLGFAALIGRLDYRAKYPNLNERYKREQDLLASMGLACPDSAPHHLGHAVLNAGTSGFIAAGASGMLPSTNVREYWESTPELSDILLQGEQRNWYTWEGDAAAGYHDMVAAETILQRVHALDSGNPAQGPNMIDSQWLDYAARIDTELINIH